MAKHRGHNEGTITERTYTKKDGTKAVKYVARAPIGDDGKRPSLGSFDTRREAKEALDAAVVAKAIGQLVGGKAPTVKEWCEKWLAGRTRIAYNTRKAYQASFASIYPHIGAVRLDRLTEADCGRMWRALEESGLALTTLDRRHAHLKAAIAAAVRDRNVPVHHNPLAAEEARPARGERQEINPLSEDEVRALLAATTDTREYPLWLTLITTGMRHGEAQGLRWKDVDLDRRTVSIRNGLHFEKGRGWLDGDTKTRRSRLVSLRPETVSALRAHKVQQAERRLRAGADWSDRGLVFTTDTGQPLDQRFIQRSFAHACERAGIIRRKIKELRHTYATIALRKGVHPKVVQEALGHTTIATTLNIYSHVIPGLQAESLGFMDGLFASG